ncbi:Hypothetical predicted protein [Marmota monax]|uniref:Uncharacterized protein n=1 Tax=Marmota monax TaxID=9995 RepID=A0A5E4B9X9_MARMO|nr:Hypothetical predicted protein [Marmota monax]
MKLLHNQLPTSAQRQAESGIRNPAGAVTCRLLLSQFLPCWLAEGEGGRREGLGGKGSPVWPVCRYIYILPAGGPVLTVRAGGSDREKTDPHTALQVFLQ